MIIEFKDVKQADLILGAEYEGGTKGNIGDEVIGKLIPCGNSGGIRQVGKSEVKAIVLFSNDNETWKNEFDDISGKVIYYGDNNEIGRDLHATKGNRRLRIIFDKFKNDRFHVPPIFIFK